MIDFVKVTINEEGKAEELRQNSTFVGIQSKDLIAHMRLVAHDSGRVVLSGSLHKYWADGYNWNDFGRVDLYDVIHEICGKLNTVPQSMKIHNLEYGVNIRTPISATDVCKRLVSYKDEVFVRTMYPAGYFVEASKKNYFVKCYDKGRQQGVGEDLLRFERKAMTAKDLKPMGIVTLGDLLKVECLERLGADLLHTIDKVVINEGLEGQNLTATERRTVEIVTNANEWEKLKKQHKRRSYLLEQYEAILKKYKGHTPTLKERLRQLIRDKWNELLGWQNWAVLHNSTKLSTTEGRGIDLGGFTGLCIVVKPTSNTSRLERANDGGLNSKSKCGNCGRVLAEPIYKSEKGGGLYCNATCEAQKKRRNEKSNPRNGFRRKYQKRLSGAYLFDQSDYIKLTPEQQHWLATG